MVRPSLRVADQPFTCPCPCATWTAQGGWGTNVTWHEGEITPEGDNCDTACPDCPDPYSIAPNVGGGAGPIRPIRPTLTAPSVKRRR